MKTYYIIDTFDCEDYKIKGWDNAVKLAERLTAAAKRVGIPAPIIVRADEYELSH
jgi:hypothetical protein